MMLLLHWQSTGVTMSVDEFWKKKQEKLSVRAGV